MFSQDPEEIQEGLSVETCVVEREKGTPFVKMLFIDDGDLIFATSFRPSADQNNIFILNPCTIPLTFRQVIKAHHSHKNAFTVTFCSFNWRDF